MVIPLERMTVRGRGITQGTVCAGNSQRDGRRKRERGDCGTENDWCRLRVSREGG